MKNKYKKVQGTLYQISVVFKVVSDLARSVAGREHESFIQYVNNIMLSFTFWVVFWCIYLQRVP